MKPEKVMGLDVVEHATASKAKYFTNGIHWKDAFYIAVGNLFPENCLYIILNSSQ